MLPYGYILAHVVRLLEIAKELKKRRYKIIFAGAGHYLHLIKKEGFDVLSLLEANHQNLMSAIRKNKIKFIGFEELENLVKADISLYRKINPNLVLSDGRISALLSTRIYGVLHGAIVNASSTEYRSVPYLPLLPFLTKTDLKKVWQTLQMFNVKLECKVFNLLMRNYTKLSKKYRLNKPVKTSEFLTGSDFTLFPDLPEYFPTYNLPQNFYYIGPITWKSNLTAPSWFTTLRDDKSVIYITMGSTTQRDIYKLIHQLFKNLNYQVVITTGEQLKDKKMFLIPGKIFIEDYVNGDLIMKKSKVVICHGGNGTIYQAIKNGVPIIGIPTHHDQSYNMKRVESLKIGIKLDYNKFRKSPQLLIIALQKILTNSHFYKAIEKYQKIIERYNPIKRAVNIIEKYIKKI